MHEVSPLFLIACYRAFELARDRALPLCYEEDRQLLLSAFDSLGSTVMLLDELLSFEV